MKWFELNMKNPNPYSGKASLCITGSSEEKEHCNDFSSDAYHWAQPHRYGCTSSQQIFWSLKLKPYLKPNVPALSRCISMHWCEAGRHFQCKAYSRGLLFLAAVCSREPIPPEELMQFQSIPETQKASAAPGSSQAKHFHVHNAP